MASDLPSPSGATGRSLLWIAATLSALQAGAAVTGRSAAPPERERPPGLLVLVADDTSRVNLGVFGDPVARTPHVDRLARAGLCFQRACAPVGICTPSRASMYTGFYPSVHGATGFDPIRDEIATLPEILNAAGVATGLIGKVHVEPEARFPFGFLATGEAYLKQRDADAFAAALEEFLRLASGRPFACFVNFKDPHRPFGYKKDEQHGGAPSLHMAAEVPILPFLWDTPETREDLARYYDALARMDATLGRLLEVLADSGRGDETLVIFTSDNGMPFPYAKATLYEAGINVPFVVRWPGVVAQGGTTEATVGLVDLLPTALELFGLPPRELHGRSLLPLLRGEVPSVRDDWFAMHTSQKIGEECPSRSVRRGNHKYIRNLHPDVHYKISGFNRSRTWQSWLELLEQRDEPALEEHMDRLIQRPAEELYDLAADPFEQQNLAPDPAQAATLAEMRALLAQRMRDFGDLDGLLVVEPVDADDAGDASRAEGAER